MVSIMENYIINTSFFVNELIRMIDEGKTLKIEGTCEHIEKGDICEFIQELFGYSDININKNLMQDINFMLREKYVSVKAASELKVNNNGLLLLVRLIIDDYKSCLFNMENSDILVESFRRE